MAIETTAKNKHENWVWKGISRDLGYEGRILATSTESDHLPVFVGHLAWLRHVSKFTLCVL